MSSPEDAVKIDFVTELGESVKRFRTNSQNTHQAQTNNSSAYVVQKLHGRYYPNFSTEDMLNDIERVLTDWVQQDLVKHGIVKADDPETATFLKKIVEAAKTADDQWDLVKTKAGDRFCRLWEVLYCLIDAIGDDDAFIDPDFDYPTRCRELHRRMVDVLQGRCHTGMRNDFLKVLHRQYRFPDGEEVFILTSVIADVSQMIVEHYQTKLNRYLSSEKIEERALGFRIYKAWLDDEVGKLHPDDAEVLRKFRHENMEVLQETILSYIANYNIPKEEDDNIIHEVKVNFDNLDSQNCPTPTIQTPLFDAIREVLRNPHRFDIQWRSRIQQWSSLNEVDPMILVVVRRERFLRKVRGYANTLPFGELEGKLKSEAQRLEGVLTHFSLEGDAKARLEELHQLDEAFSLIIATVRAQNPHYELGNSFAMLIASRENDTQFRTLFHALLDRPECQIEEHALRTLLETVAREEEGVTVLDLRPETANTLLWHAIRTSLAEWSDDFQTLIRLFLGEVKKEGHDENTKSWIDSSFRPLEEQLQWMLQCAETKNFIQPRVVLVPCNLEGLAFSSQIIRQYRNLTDFFFSPLGNRGWWLGLPAMWYEEKWYTFAEDPAIFNTILRNSSKRQNETALFLMMSDLLQKEWFWNYCFLNIPRDLRLVILHRYIGQIEPPLLRCAGHYLSQSLEALPKIAGQLSSHEQSAYLAFGLTKSARRIYLQEQMLRCSTLQSRCEFITTLCYLKTELYAIENALDCAYGFLILMIEEELRKPFSQSRRIVRIN